MESPGLETVSSRPLVSLSLALNYAAGGLDPRGYHVVNVALHVAAALLLWGLVRRTLAGPRLGPTFGAAAGPLAFATALLWVVHPLGTEAVTYVVQRTEIMAALGILGTLYAFVRGAASPRPGRWWAAAVAACAFGVASKESAAVAPLLVLAYDRLVLRGSLRRRPALYAGLFASWALLALLLRQGRLEHVAILGSGVPPLAYARTQLAVVAHYLRLAVWPHPLVLDYGWPLAAGWAEVARPALVVVALAAATLWALRRAPAAAFLGVAFFVLLAPTSSVLPIGNEIAAERRMYLPLAAVIAALVVAVWRMGRRVGGPAARLGVPALALVAALLGLAAARRNAVYATEVGIWRDTIAKRPDNARAHQNLSAALKRAGRTDDALVAWAQALRLSPEQGAARFNEANAAYLQGRYAEASRLYALAALSLPHVARIRTNLGASLLAEGKREEAIQQFEEALRLDPNDEMARQNLRLARGGFTPPAR